MSGRRGGRRSSRRAADCAAVCAVSAVSRSVSSAARAASLRNQSSPAAAYARPATTSTSPAVHTRAAVSRTQNMPCVSPAGPATGRHIQAAIPTAATRGSPLVRGSARASSMASGASPHRTSRRKASASGLGGHADTRDRPFAPPAPPRSPAPAARCAPPVSPGSGVVARATKATGASSSILASAVSRRNGPSPPARADTEAASRCVVAASSRPGRCSPTVLGTRGSMSPRSFRLRIPRCAAGIWSSNGRYHTDGGNPHVAVLSSRPRSPTRGYRPSRDGYFRNGRRMRMGGRTVATGLLTEPALIVHLSRPSFVR
jgi:hypothetical protein